jgi:hypothetical protein
MSNTAFALPPSSQEDSLLFTLPAELLIQICQSLSEHHSTKQYTRIKPVRFDSRSYFENDAQVLSRLSRTCQRVHDIANPILYHSGPRDEPGAYKRYFRTLYHRPDLSKQVRTLDLHEALLLLARDEDLMGLSASCFDARLPKGWLNSYRGQLDQIRSLGSNYTKEDLYTAFDSIFRADTRAGRNFLHTFLARLLLEWTLNVECLGIWDLPEYGLGVFMQDSSTLQSLKSLEVIGSISDGTTESIKHLLGKAPNLERISLRDFVTIPEPCNLPENLQCISLVHCLLTLRMFRNITSSCQRLKKFVYQIPSGLLRPWPDGAIEPLMDWKQLIEELKPYQKTLEHLTMCQFFFPAIDSDKRQQADPSISFKEFTALKHLWIDGAVLLPERGPPSSLEMGAALEEFLPESIVSVTTDHFDAEYFDDLAELKRSLGSNMFPNLERFHIGFLDDISRNEYASFQQHLAQPFAASGQFVAEDGGFQYRGEGSEYRWVWEISQDYPGGVYYRLKD